MNKVEDVSYTITDAVKSFKLYRKRIIIILNN